MKLVELQAPEEVRELELQLDRLMMPVGLDVAFTKHFIERLLGRERRVTIEEVVSTFNKLKSLPFSSSARLMVDSPSTRSL